MMKLLTRAVVFGAILCLASAAQAQSDVTAPGDPLLIVNGTNDGDANSGVPPANEQPARAIDNITQKYLNFLDLGSGFIVTPTLGSGIGGTILSGARFYTANDAPERDPASYLIEGGLSDAGPWTTISQGALALPTGRNMGGLPPAGIPVDPAVHFNQLVSFANSTPYTSYRVTFPTLRNAGTANSMQIGEVELLGVAIPEPSTFVLAGAGLVGLIVALRRRSKA
jgi:hypothetical protein